MDSWSNLQQRAEVAIAAPDKKLARLDAEVRNITMN